MTSYSAEPEAAAVILAKTRSIKYQTSPDVGQLIKHFERIKIFNETAFRLGEVLIEYYHLEELESIEHLRAMITYPDGKMLELEKQHVKVSELNDEWTQVILMFPKLVRGCIIEYEYTLKKNYISDPEAFVFQSEIPLRYASFAYEIPQTIKYTFLTQGDKYIKVGEKDFTMINVPSIREDAYMTVIDDYIGKIETRIESYYDYYIVNQIMNPSVENMLRSLAKDRLFGQQYRKEIFGRKLISEAKGILENENSTILKINNLQDFILDNVAWNGKMEIRCSKPINKLFKDGEAGSTELNLMLLVLMKQLEIEAYPVLLSTRSNGQAFSSFPIESDFSYAAVIAEIDGSTMLFDIADKFKPPSMLNYQALNEYGLVMKDGAPYWVNIKVDLTRDVLLGEFKLESDELKGKFSTRHFNYSGLFERDFTRDEDFLDHWKMAFQKRFPRAYIYDGSYENLELINEEFKQEFSARIPGAVEFREDSIYIMPFLFGFHDEYPFTQEKRGYEIDFAYPFSEQYIFRLEIPAGYEVLSLPEKFVVVTPDRMASLLIDPTITDQQIQIIKKLEMRKAIYSEEESAAIMLLFKELDARVKEKIVLIKSGD